MPTGFEKSGMLIDPIAGLIMDGNQVDMVVDLAGATPNGRPSLIAHHPGLVQIGLIGPPYGVAMPGIDIILSDPAMESADRRYAGKGQTVSSIDTGAFALSAFEFMPDIVPPPSADTGSVTFGVKADPGYWSDATLELWADILEKIDGARLLLGGVARVSLATNTIARDWFAVRGLENRIYVHRSGIEDDRDPAFFNAIDIYLDTTPVSGRMEICEALWMGVPVVTMKGTRRASVVGASLLASAGKSNWIASSPAAYVDCAVALANNGAELAVTRETLRDEVSQSQLFKPELLTRAIEKIARDTLQNWLPPST